MNQIGLWKKVAGIQAGNDSQKLLQKWSDSVWSIDAKDEKLQNMITIDKTITQNLTCQLEL